MKKRLQGMMMGVLATVLLLSTATVFAATPQQISVTFGGVRTTLFGQEFVVRDAQGLVVEPLVFNGRAYIPVEAVIQAMGDNAQWNAATGTLNFGTATGAPASGTPQSFLAAAPIQSATGTVWAENQVNVRGTTFDEALLFRGAGREAASSQHNLGGRYTTLSGNIGRTDGMGISVRFSFYGDGHLLRSFDIGPNELIPVSISVSGVQQLEIRYAVTTMWSGTFAFADAILE